QHVSTHFPATLAEQGAYLGWPVLVIVAWFAVRERTPVARLLLVLLGLAVFSLAPAVWRIAYRDIPERWPFFTEGLYKTCIPRGENVAVFPFGVLGNSMLWQ